MKASNSRVVVRDFVNSDISVEYAGWLNDYDVTRYSNQRFVSHSLSSCMDYFKSFENTDNSFLAILDISTDAMIGTATIYRSIVHGTADIGLLIGNKSYWGKGYGKSVFRLLLETISKENGMRKITAGTAATNKAMQNVCISSGMELDCIKRRQEIIDGIETDLLYYAYFC